MLNHFNKDEFVVHPPPQKKVHFHSKKKHVPSAVTSIFSSVTFSSSPRQPLIYFLCRLAYPWTFYVKMKSCNMWSFMTGFFHLMFPRFIHVVALVSIHSFFFFLQFSIVWPYISIHHLMDIWVAYAFWVLWVMLLWTVYTCLCGVMFSSLLVYV